MFDSFGLGELGIVVLLLVLFVKPSDIGRFLRWFAKLQRRLYHWQSDLRDQLEKLVDEDDMKIALDKPKGKQDLRKAAKERLTKLSAMERHQHSREVIERLMDWEKFQKANVVAAFFGKFDEIETEPLLRRILSGNKKLLLPFVNTDNAMHFAEITDLDLDVEESRFGIQAPKHEFWGKEHSPIELILIPGQLFDNDGTRLGRGKGFYDRYLEGKKLYKVALCFEVQLIEKKLPLEAHDIQMDYIVTERRIISLAKEPPKEYESDTSTL